MKRTIMPVGFTQKTGDWCIGAKGATIRTALNAGGYANPKKGLSHEMPPFLDHADPVEVLSRVQQARVHITSDIRITKE
jgi:hypothetical protein